ncbi:DUF2591 domain-containing protein [Cronobacter turicensis]
MDYAQLEDTEITIRVGETFGWNPYFINGDGSVVFRDDRGRLKGRKDYCNNPSDAWPIMTENKISVMWMTAEKQWCAWANGNLEEGCWEWSYCPDEYHHDDNPLRAAMIVFLMMQESQNA